MDVQRTLIACLLTTGCAATTGPAPGPHALASVAAPVTEASRPHSGQPLALTRPPSHAAGSSTHRAFAPAPQASESPHGFSGGVGVRFRDGESALSFLAEYHYRVKPTLEVGGLADWAGAPIDSLLIAPAAWWHPGERLTLFGAPGVEFVSGDGATGAVRVGGSYTLSLGKLAVQPFGWYDVVPERSNSFTLGVGFGI